MLKKVALIALPALAAATAVQAGTLTEERGYNACVDQFKAQTRNLRTENEYLIRKDANTTTYFINGVAQSEYGAGRVRLTCETAGRGHRVLTADMDQGRYAPAGQVRIEVAGN